jgi:predicted outer membrane protein
MVKKEKKAPAAVAAPVETPTAKKAKAPAATPVVEEKPKKVVEDVDAEEISDNENESQTVKEKKENAKRMLKAVKAFNAKLKSSIERKEITRAV